MSYEQGFIEKCAQFGVDPQSLVKEAARGQYAVEALERFLRRFSQGAPETLDNFRLASLLGTRSPGLGLEDYVKKVRGLVESGGPPRGGGVQENLAEYVRNARRLNEGLDRRIAQEPEFATYNPQSLFNIDNYDVSDRLATALDNARNAAG